MEQLKREIEYLLSPLQRTSEKQWQNSPMIFVTGPRQVGKTYQTKLLSNAYYNWDTKEVKLAYLKDPYFFRTGDRWVIFDEIHKRRDWKKLLKGYFDSPNRTENFIVTGSGRFNLYQKGGDSLQGRYDLFHLYPMTFDEYISNCGPLLPRNFETWKPTSNNKKSQEQELIKFGGFPEPLVRGTEARLNKWLDLYLQRLIEEDLRDFSKVELLDKIELLARLLPGRVGSPISFQSLSEDVEAARESIKTWMRLMETLYFGFFVPPYHRRIERAVKKEKKWYFFQWAFVESPGERFENYVAVQLLTICQYWRDAGLGVYELFYVRDQDRREIDFLITKNLKPVALIETKSKPQTWPSSLNYYCNKLGVSGYLVYPEGPIKKEGPQRYSLPSYVFFNGILKGS